MATDTVWPSWIARHRGFEGARPAALRPSIVKLFHAGGQDLEILYRELGVLPAPLFDTQVAATLLGHTPADRLRASVHSLCGVEPEEERPRSQRLVASAAFRLSAGICCRRRDHLPKMYRIMVEKLNRRAPALVDNDFAAMSDPANHESDPSERYKRLEARGAATRRQSRRAREAVLARGDRLSGRYAAQGCSPRRSVRGLRRVESRTIDDLFLIRGVREKLNTRDARAVGQRARPGSRCRARYVARAGQVAEERAQRRCRARSHGGARELRAKENSTSPCRRCASRSEPRASPGLTADVDAGPRLAPRYGGRRAAGASRRPARPIARPRRTRGDAAFLRRLHRSPLAAPPGRPGRSHKVLHIVDCPKCKAYASGEPYRFPAVAAQRIDRDAFSHRGAGAPVVREPQAEDSTPMWRTPQG
ncbi:MAG: hypothetical protein ACLTDR_00660 [Adlercreutzia equolifaciens]